LKAAGFPASEIFANPTKANVVVRYHGTGARRAVLLLAHIDVVEARVMMQKPALCGTRQASPATPDRWCPRGVRAAKIRSQN